jgi:hypothetical protein
MLANLVRRLPVGILPLLVLVLLTAGTLVLAFLAGVEDGGLLWWAFGLAMAGALVFLGSAGRGRYAAFGLVLIAGAAAVSGWAVWRTPDVGGIEELLGEGGPSVLTAATWLLVLLVAVLAAVTALWRKEITGISARTWCALLAVAAFLVGVAGTGVWLGARGLVALRETTIADADVEHTVDASADPASSPRRDAVTGPSGWRKLWQQPANVRTVVGVPAAPFAVSATGGGDGPGIAVHDNRTGTERWRFHTESFGYDDTVAVSPSTDRVLLVIDRAAIVLDLDSGTEVDRIALPEPTAGPTLGSTDYKIIGPTVPRFAEQRPRIEITGSVVHIAVTGHPGPSDVLTMNLRTGELTTFASEVPEYCRFRALRPAEYVNTYDYETWLLRDGIGCGTPTLTRMFDGRRQTGTPITQDCDPSGCELPYAYATSREIVVQTAARLLTLDLLGTLRASVPIEKDRRSVILPDATTPTVLPAGVTPRANTVFARDGATSFQYRPTGGDAGQLVRIDTATGRASEPSETVRCAEPTLSISATVLILSCRSGVLAFG